MLRVLKTNFEIIKNYAVQLNGIHIDLHNNFDFAGLSKKGNIISIVFQKNEGDWVKKEEFLRLNFEFKDVTYEYYVDGDPKALKEATEGLREITFFPSDNRETNNALMPQLKPKNGDDLIMFFEDGKIIRIGCDEITLTTEK